MTFHSREDAGVRLGRHLLERGVAGDIVLGLPRGGVVVAAEVARALRLPLDVIVVRKIGHPWYREFAVGALAEGGVVMLDQAAIAHGPIIQDDLDRVIAEETERLRVYQSRFHRAERLDRAGKDVLIVDDGIATGATTEAAVAAARKQGARRIIVATPVASTNAVDHLRNVADEVIALHTDPEFDAVGRYYQEFSQTSDDEVMALLQTHERMTT